MSWKVGELAKMAGISVRTLHHYEQIGLLVASGRTESGYRLYDHNDLYKLMQILCLSQIGMPLSEVQKVLGQYPDGILGHLKQHLDGLSQRITQMQAVQDRLQKVMRKIADNQQPTWLDWAVSPELVELYEKRGEADSFDTVVLYESYLQQSAVWQKLLQRYNALCHQQSEPHELAQCAWDIRTEFEALTDFNRHCYEQVWYSEIPSFTSVDAAYLNGISTLWAQQHLQIWMARLSAEQGVLVQQHHHQAIQAWPSVLVMLGQLETETVSQQQAYQHFNQWLVSLVQGNAQHAKSVIICFLTEPLLEKGLCLNQARRALWHDWICQVLTSIEFT